MGWPAQARATGLTRARSGRARTTRRAPGDDPHPRWPHPLARPRPPAQPRRPADVDGRGRRLRHPGLRADRRRSAPPSVPHPRRPHRRGRRRRQRPRLGRAGRRRRRRPRRGRPPEHRHLPVARRRPPHPHPVQLGRDVPRRRPGPARRGLRPGLDGHHRPRFRHPRQARRRAGQPRHRRRAQAVRRPDPRLPGPGVEHPGRRARHRLRPPRLARGRGPQGVRELLRRRRQTAGPPPRRPTRRTPSTAWTSSPRR